MLYREFEVVKQLFSHGLETYHLRKHDFTYAQMDNYLKNIPSEFHPSIIIHSHYGLVNKYNLKGVHVSTLNPGPAPEPLPEKCYKSTFCYNLEDIELHDHIYDQVIIGPVFKSISNPEYYNCKYNHEALSKFLMHHQFESKILAIGGIDENNSRTAIRFGFDGVVVLGSLWLAYLETMYIDQALSKYLKIKEICLQLYN
jgi:thiamine-phosphate pyrophosphorylase